ncbi:hypothetical protein EON80_26615 [bacterium]|nr:MAG: hypothetical protein EON80_26615 [bacterium]
MESISGFWWVLFFVGLLTVGHWLLERLLVKVWPRRFASKARNYCPRCEQLALKHVYHVVGKSNPPSPNCYLCQSCGARWKRYFNGPLEDAADAKYDYYFSEDVPYYNRGETDNGQEPMEVVPFEPNWVKCPGCGRRFRLDSASKSGKYLMHTTCGQRLIIKGT